MDKIKVFSPVTPTLHIHNDVGAHFPKFSQDKDKRFFSPKYESSASNNDVNFSKINQNSETDEPVEKTDKSESSAPEDGDSTKKHSSRRKSKKLKAENAK